MNEISQLVFYTACVLLFAILILAASVYAIVVKGAPPFEAVLPAAVITACILVFTLVCRDRARSRARDSRCRQSVPAVEAASTARLPRETQPADPTAIVRNDAEAARLVEEYRERFADAPLGKWFSENDAFSGLGFQDVVGLAAAMDFNLDGRGVLRHYGSWPTETRFEWRPKGLRAVEIRVTEWHSLDEEQWPDEEEETLEECDRQWVTVEYDFFVVTHFHAEVLLFQSPPIGDGPCDWGFWESLYPLKRIGEADDITAPWPGRSPA